MYFYNQVVVMDGFIVSWDVKMYYDFVCFYVLVYEYYQDQVIKVWGGEGKGMMDMKGD